MNRLEKGAAIVSIALLTACGLSDEKIVETKGSARVALENARLTGEATVGDIEREGAEDFMGFRAAGYVFDCPGYVVYNFSYDLQSQ